MKTNRLFVFLITITLLLGGISCAQGTVPAPAGPTPAPAAPTATPISALDTTPSVINAVRFTEVFRTTATVLWETRVPTVGRVEYGHTDQFGLSTPWTLALSTHDAFILDGLDVTTVYFIMVRVKDAAGNEAVSKTKTLYIYGDRVYNPGFTWET